MLCAFQLQIKKKNIFIYSFSPVDYFHVSITKYWHCRDTIIKIIVPCSTKTTVLICIAHSKSLNLKFSNHKKWLFRWSATNADCRLQQQNFLLAKLVSFPQMVNLACWLFQLVSCIWRFGLSAVVCNLPVCSLHLSPTTFLTVTYLFTFRNFQYE